MKCTEVLAFGRLGATVEDETPNRICGRTAVWKITGGNRPIYRCEEHARRYRALGTRALFEDLLADQST